MDEKTIKDEIFKNGNTNFISNSNLSSGAQIFAIGDSHSIFFYNSLKIKEHWLGCTNLPISIHRLLNEGIDIYQVGNHIGNGHEKYNIKEGDFVIFYYGFNDIQKNIYLHAKNNWIEVIEKIFSDYIEYIKKITEQYTINPIIPCIYPNPTLIAEGVNVLGTIHERRQYTNKANNILEYICKNNNIPFLNIYDFITDENGFIKKEFTKDNIHLDYDNNLLREHIENEIYKLIKSIN